MKQTIDDYILNVLKPLNSKKIIVTGATSGIGLALSRILVFKNAHLIMAVRNVLKGNLLKDKFLAEFPKAKIDVVHLDQGDFSSIDKFVNKVKTSYPDYDTLVLNAGVFNTNKGIVLDNGYPIVSGTNMFGPIYIVNELIKFDNGAKHKIIFQGSLAKNKSKYRNFDNAFMNSFRNHFEQYNLSKLGLYNAFNYFHNNRSESFSFYWAEPGISGTEIIRRYPTKFKKFAQKVMNAFFAKPLEACLPVASIINNDLPSGISSAPGGLFHVAGLPTIIKFNPRIINPEIMTKALESIYERK
ncbi:MAG: SDR family NAD(P)-dependent oxidoreductase [Bacilli bacterium]|nr:SDR family NAD(P)-dependent oxidoreductase [Bacilli bacterium]